MAVFETINASWPFPFLSKSHVFQLFLQLRDPLILATSWSDARARARSSDETHEICGDTQLDDFELV